MARVTVEDCIDKVENRFDLVLLASHRARMISSGSQIAVERDNDKNPVVALREIADKAVSPEDLKEELVHSLQKYVEVDEPEPEGVPLIGAPGTGVDADDTEVTTDRMSEEELLKGLEGLTPPESQPEPESTSATTKSKHVRFQRTRTQCHGRAVQPCAGMTDYGAATALLRCLEHFGDVFPIDQIIDERLEVVRAPVAVVDVIGVLPDVAAEDRAWRREPAGFRRSRSSSLSILPNLTASQHQPEPNWVMPAWMKSSFIFATDPKSATICFSRLPGMRSPPPPGFIHFQKWM